MRQPNFSNLAAGFKRMAQGVMGTAVTPTVLNYKASASDGTELAVAQYSYVLDNQNVGAILSSVRSLLTDAYCGSAYQIKVDAPQALIEKITTLNRNVIEGLLDDPIVGAGINKLVRKVDSINPALPAGQKVLLGGLKFSTLGHAEVIVTIAQSQQHHGGGNTPTSAHILALRGMITRQVRNALIVRQGQSLDGCILKITMVECDGIDESSIKAAAQAGIAYAMPERKSPIPVHVEFKGEGQLADALPQRLKQDLVIVSLEFDPTLKEDSAALQFHLQLSEKDKTCLDALKAGPLTCGPDQCHSPDMARLSIAVIGAMSGVPVALNTPTMTKLSISQSIEVASGQICLFRGDIVKSLNEGGLMNAANSCYVSRNFLHLQEATEIGIGYVICDADKTASQLNVSHSVPHTDPSNSGFNVLTIQGKSPLPLEGIFVYDEVTTIALHRPGQINSNGTIVCEVVALRAPRGKK